MDVSVKAGQNPPIYGQRQDGNLGRLLCVDRDRWTASSLTSTDTTSDVFKLGVTVGMIGALASLAIALQ